MSDANSNTDYLPTEIERKWQQHWEDAGLYSTKEDSTLPKWYALTMLPYPSGDLHAGHWYAMTPSDAAARFRRMLGYNVFFPMGFDAFGLPAENAAIKHNIHPNTWTQKNIERMRLQLKQMGAMYAWDREAITCQPGYYQWTQWLFLRFFEAGLAYREFAPVDWCPSCQTTLAREQVWGDDRHCERCKTPVIKKDLYQWKLKITDYAEELLEGLNQLEWPERVKNMQQNWIGKSQGASITFETETRTTLEVFTTRPDTLWGATFMVIAPEHPLVSLITSDEQKEAVEAYQEASASMDDISRTATDKEKTGVFTGGYAINPATRTRIPIWIADYVLMGYGTGAIMAVPAHDQRDFEFARKFGLDIKPVISPDGEPVKQLEEAYTEKDGVIINSGELSGTPVSEAICKAVQWLEKNLHGEASTSYRLHDWLISRQRMWGCPIPMIICQSCGDVPVPYEQLPVVLPEDAEFKPTGESPLKSHKDFMDVSCPKCGSKEAHRETDTMDTFMCSSWYQYGYITPNHKNGEKLSRDDLPWDKEQGDYWLPVDQYTGGVEHATMHLLYTRFFTKALRDMGLVNFDEPMKRLFSQGMILGPDGEKMSKSRGNVVNPDSYVDKYGADTVRGYIMFIGPWDQGGPWDPGAIEGVKRFVSKVWHLCHPELQKQISKDTQPDDKLIKQTTQLLHSTILKVTESMETFKFNTAIAGCMELANHLSKHRNSLVGEELFSQSITNLILLMAPIFPHVTEELWHAYGNSASVHLQPWPKADKKKAVSKEVTIVVQVNGKLRDKLTVDAETDKATLEEQAKSLPNVQKWTEGKEIKKVIVVPGKLVNIVVAG